MSDDANSETSQVKRGIVWVSAGHGVLFLITALAEGLAPKTEELMLLLIQPLLYIGVSQLIYVGPGVWLANQQNRPGRVKGLVIAASLTALLNAACWSSDAAKTSVALVMAMVMDFDLRSLLFN